MQLLIRQLIGLGVLMLSCGAMACSDTLYRVGKDVSYRVYTAPLPGSVLVYGHSDGAKQLADALAQSGHGVRFVEDETQLTSELATRNYDVVIAPLSDRSAVEASTSASGNDKTVYLPIALNRDEAETAGQSYAKVMVADQHEIKHYLKAIHKALKAKT